MRNWQDAVDEYKMAIKQFGDLGVKHPGNRGYQEQLAYSHMWLGETLRLWLESSPKPTQYTTVDARSEYDQAITIQQQLVQKAPDNRDYQQELARSYYNRGILSYSGGSDPLPDFQRAMALLGPLTSGGKSTEAAAGGSEPAQDLARVDNNIGVTYDYQKDYKRAAAMYQKAVLALGPLRQQDPGNREYKVEAARYYVDLAAALYSDDKIVAAKQANSAAQALVEELTKPDPTVEKLRADAAATAKSLSKP
jgi:tetratricopeptide (TPR) repeat protein